MGFGLLKAAYLAVKTAPPATRDRAERTVQQLLAKQEAKRKIVEEAQKRLADMEAGRRPPKAERKPKVAAAPAVPTSPATPPERTRAPRTAKPKAAPPAPPAPPAAGPRADEAVEDELTAMFAEDDKQ